ncbi:MAG: EAL domain-containing protein [Lachnospiraceae bacterium]|nr:EAL domain-containing protein [Lachnospiraceae bacterium]
MEKAFFEWAQFSGENGNTAFPVEAIEELFLMDFEEGTIWLSKKLANLLYFEKEEILSKLSMEEFYMFFSEGGREIFKEEVQRLRNGKVNRVNSHVAVIREKELLSAVCYVFRLPQPRYLLGFLSIDYQPIQEYEQQMEVMIRKMQWTQNVNQLTLEGSADYVYQFDLVENVCTFSSKALEVLPLESATVPDAMSRMLELVIPEDRQMYLDSLTPFLTAQSDCHKVKYRVRNRNGEIMWLSSQGKGLHDESGKPLLLAGSMIDITEQQEREAEIRQMLYYDSLTKLKNRLCFEEELEKYLQQPDVKGSFVYINIRKFKLFNEMFGKSFADRILQEFARMLKLYFPGALGIYRFVGDEFLVHLSEHTREEIMGRLIPFQSSLKNSWEMEGHTLYVNMYAAVVMYPEDGADVEELVLHANQCLHRLARDEKEEIRFFTGQTGEDISKQYRLENELRKDIRNDFQHFRVVYQPIVHLKGGEHWEGAEALLRYSNPDLPNVGQMEMIRTLEQSGMILQVGRWVISQAVKECSRWNKATGKNMVVHVNMAAQQIPDAGLIKHIKEECRVNDLPYSSLVIELTETSLVNNFAQATELCQALKRLGVGVALDDFGTGYSGFTYLRDFPISQIKVDREYAKDIPTNLYNQVIVSFMRNLSRNMNVGLCVEGVETEDELTILLHMGVDTIQGFYFERPMEAENIRKEFIRRAVGNVE